MKKWNDLVRMATIQLPNFNSSLATTINLLNSFKPPDRGGGSGGGGDDTWWNPFD